MSLYDWRWVVIALEKQYNLFLTDTGNFYTNHEKYLHDMNCKYRQEKNYIKNKLKGFQSELLNLGYNQKDIQKFNILKSEDVELIDGTEEIVGEYLKWASLINHKSKKAAQSKLQLSLLLKNKVKQNEITQGKDHIRKLRKEDLNDTNIISVFDSALSRIIGIRQDEFTDALIVLQVYYFDVFKDMCYFGFEYNGNKYKYFTSSAGQIRKKKGVFIREDIWNRVEKTLMCGLTIEAINNNGGNNVNKHLAYMALNNSATDEWKDFDIDRCIVIDDFETNVFGTFDFVDDNEYTIIRKNDYVPIPHTDGAGMILPSLSKKNFMFRAPWIKGLLGVFDFVKFIREYDYSYEIKDIYGQVHNILDENIQIILTKSQFKLYKHYNSWDEYKEFYKTYNCQAGVCNVEEDRIKNAKINYQMLQTLTDITEDEMDTLAEKSLTRIKNICTSKETMMDIMGVTPYNYNPTAFQRALKLYPPLLSDTYVKDVIREIKDSLLKKYRSGKLEISGKYTFVLPDFYAACEYWFGHIKEPKGLLDDGEVFCNLFKHSEKLDCLRSPHLFREHPVRKNIACDLYGDRAESIRKWFSTNGIYTSTHDLITKIVMLDVDGDKLLVVADKTFVDIAERNMKDIVPLYYDMKKAPPIKLTNESIYNGLNQAFSHGNIGIYSNNISKIWNSKELISGTKEQQDEALKVIKLLCMENNFQIDAAKTMYMPTRPQWVKSLVAKYTNRKLPAFFEFAKDKKKNQIVDRNKSFVNQLYDKIPNVSINTRGLNLGKIDYKLMMHNPEVVCAENVKEIYDKLNSKYRYMISMKDEFVDNLRYVACEIRNKFSETGYSEDVIADMLTQYLYGNNKRYKQLYWFCYGQYIVKNIENNIGYEKTKYIQCEDCGEWIEVKVTNKRTCRCKNCQLEYTRKLKTEMQKKYRL